MNTSSANRDRETCACAWCGTRTAREDTTPCQGDPSEECRARICQNCQEGKCMDCGHLHIGMCLAKRNARRAEVVLCACPSARSPQARPCAKCGLWTCPEHREALLDAPDAREAVICGICTQAVQP